MRRQARHLVLALEADAQRALDQLVVLCRGELAALLHLREHRVAPGLGALGVEHGVVVGRALEHADERGALQHRELVGGFVEVGARRHLDAVGVVEEGHGVQVGLQDLVLGVQPLDLERGDRLLDLARERGRAADVLGVEVARELLGDGGAALLVAAQRAHQRRRRAPPVQAEVVVEAVVLGGDQGIDHRPGDRVERHPLAVHPAVFGQQAPVGGQQLRGLVALGLADVADGGRERDQRQHVQEDGQRQRGQQPQQAMRGCPALGPARQACQARPQQGPARAQGGGKRHEFLQ